MSISGKMFAQIFGILFLFTVSASCALGNVSFAVQGDSGANMTDTSPGEEVTLDFTPVFDPADILDVAGFTILFQADSWLDRIRIRLSDSTEFTIDDVNNRLQVSWNFYDPVYIDPDTIHYEYKSPITQALKDELMDGVFSAHIWIENDLGDWVGPTIWQFGSTVGYDLVPEPASLGILFIGGLCLMRKRT